MNKLLAMACAFLLLGSGFAAAAQPRAAPPGKIVTVNGIQMHYEERGSGEPLLLLHGFGMCGPGDWGKLPTSWPKAIA